MQTCANLDIPFRLMFNSVNGAGRAVISFRHKIVDSVINSSVSVDIIKQLLKLFLIRLMQMDEKVTCLFAV